MLTPAKNAITSRMEVQGFVQQHHFKNLGQEMKNTVLPLEVSQALYFSAGNIINYFLFH